jgi:hypothetical protein
VAERAEDGFVTVQHLLAVGLSLLLLVQLANVVVAAYGRAALRAALDEGVRSAAVLGGDAAGCERRAAAVLDDLLAGSMRREVEVLRCRVEAERVHGDAEARFAAWLPGAPSLPVRASALVSRTAP